MRYHDTVPKETIDAASSEALCNITDINSMVVENHRESVKCQVSSARQPQ